MSLVHNIALTLIKNVGARQARKLIKAFGDAERVFRASHQELMAVQGIGRKIAHAICTEDAQEKAEKQLAFIKKYHITVLFFTDEQYPKRLRHCDDAPVILYFKGKVNFNRQRIIGIVGTRKATNYGKAVCKKLIEALVPYEVIVISGLAYGIDIAAHTACVHFKIPTIGVLGHGLDRIYPRVHTGIARDMMDNGGLLTEFLPGTMPDKKNFPKRNRIIAGLCDALIVIEASAKGGALITADLANSYFREVFAFPGRATDGCSEGCNFLIKTHRAALITGIDDLVYQLGWESIVIAKEKNPAESSPDPDSSSQKVLAVLKDAILTIDEIIDKTGLPQSKLAMVLLELEIKGNILTSPGKCYQLR